MRFLKKAFVIRETGLLVIVVAFTLTLFFTVPAFKDPINIFGVLSGLTINLIIAGAMTVLFVSGGFDMSVGVTMGYCGMVVGLLLVRYNMPIPLAILITILVGMTIGSVIGFFIAYVEMNPFVVTLAAWFIIESFKYIINGGRNVTGIPTNFYSVSFTKILNIPTIIIFAFLSAVVFDLLLRKNTFIRKYYAIGGNEKAAIVAGIPIKKMKLISYMLVSTMASVAGIFYTSRFMAGFNEAGAESAFQIITAVIIGGASLKGGRGSVTGTFLGLIFMALVYDALVLYGLDILWNRVAIGLLLILAILMDENFVQRRSLASKN